MENLRKRVCVRLVNSENNGIQTHSHLGNTQSYSQTGETGECSFTNYVVVGSISVAVT